MKIVLLSFGPGGMLHYALDLYTSLVNSNNDVLLLTSENSDAILKNINYKNINPQNIKQIYREIQEFSPDIVHITAYHPSLILLVFYLSKYKLIYTIHDCISHPYGFSLLKKFKLFLAYNKLYTKLILSKVSSVIALSAYVAGEVKATYKKDCKIIHLLNDKIKFDKITQQINDKTLFDKNFINVLIFGTLSKYKGVDTIINTINYLKNNSIYKNIRFIVSGRFLCEFNVEKENLVILNKYIQDSEVHNLFTNADVVLLPYSEISQSGVLCLAISYNKPIIAPNLGSFMEYKLKYPHLFIIPDLTPENILKSIQMMYEQTSIDKNIDYLSLKKMGEEYINIYKSINYGKNK